MDEGVLVSEEEIAEAMTFMLEVHHLAVEGGAVVGIAAVMHRKTEQLGKHVAIVISGGNVSLETLRQVVREEYPYQVEG
jgi:threonine dehydratase